MNEKKLSLKQLIVMGGALFSMHFGASCMLYPVTWGKESGSSVFTAYIAIVLSALLLPLLAYVALSRGSGNFYSITRRISPKFGPIFCAVTVMIMGPIYVIPRMSAAAWAALMQLTGIRTTSILPIFLFNCVYYAITYWFVSSRSDTVDKVGKILFPILILIVVGVICKGLITPISTEWQPKSYPESPLAYGFLQGYQTGDLPAALMFGMVIIQGIRKAGIPESGVNKNMVRLGLVGMGMLAITHLGHMIVGAGTGGTIDLTLSALYSEVVLQLWGSIGAVFFNIALMFAALTTAIGLAGSTAEYFEAAMDEKIPYKRVALVTVIISTVLASMGLDNIVTFVGPLLDCCYPAAIVVVIYYVLARNNLNPRYLNGARFAMFGAAAMGFIDVLSTYNTLTGLNNASFSRIYSAIPLTSVRLTWILVSILCFLIGLAVYRKKGETILPHEDMVDTELPVTE